ncbi:MAG TPA: MSMEG_4193 family putative phosphomutase [Dehalococcoidia bacterium]|nr:MSMEG_4193 family putative phosphomutase [Dehalococcoidia bacterium]
MTLVFLIRHGLHDWLDVKLAGWTPEVHLNENGQKQAEALVERLAPVPFDAIYSSPLERTTETAAPLALARGLEVESTKDLGEVDYGSWQGEPLKQLSKKKEWSVVRFAPSAVRFPDGESLREMQSRAVASIERIAAAHPKGTVAVFSHADVIRAIVAYFIGMPLDMFHRLTIGPASVTVLNMGEFGARLLRLNDTGPFQPPSRDGRKAKSTR